MQSNYSAAPYLFRYLKSSHIQEDIPWDSIIDSVTLDCLSSSDAISSGALELREKEDYVSLFWSPKNDDLSRILHTLNELKARGRDTFSARSGMMKIDATEAKEDINDVEELIDFKVTDTDPKDCVHFGLFFLVSDSLKLLEIRSSIIELSEFFALKKSSKSTRDILGIDRQNKVSLLGQNITL